MEESYLDMLIKDHIPNFHQWHEDCQEQVRELAIKLINMCDCDEKPT